MSDKTSILDSIQWTYAGGEHGVGGGILKHWATIDGHRLARETSNYRGPSGTRSVRKVAYYWEDVKGPLFDGLEEALLDMPKVKAK